MRVCVCVFSLAAVIERVPFHPTKTAALRCSLVKLRMRFDSNREKHTLVLSQALHFKGRLFKYTLRNDLQTIWLKSAIKAYE